jgi:hypothetical protein
MRLCCILEYPNDEKDDKLETKKRTLTYGDHRSRKEKTIKRA